MFSVLGLSPYKGTPQEIIPNFQCIALTNFVVIFLAARNNPYDFDRASCYLYPCSWAENVRNNVRWEHVCVRLQDEAVPTRPRRGRHLRRNDRGRTPDIPRLANLRWNTKSLAQIVGRPPNRALEHCVPAFIFFSFRMNNHEFNCRSRTKNEAIAKQ